MNNLVGRIQHFLGRLSWPQRFAAGTLVVVMLAGGIWLSGRNPGGGALVAILDQPFAEAEVSRICDHLRGKSIEFQVREGKVLVASDRRFDALSELYYSGVLTAGTESGFDALVKQISAWDAPSKTDKMFNRAREMTVEQVIGRYIGVRKATVIIDPTNERRLGGAVLPTAMVDIQTRGDGNPRQLATAAVNVVTGAVANLQREQVKVTVDGATYNAGREADGGDAVERRQRLEQLHVAKVRQLLSYIPDVLVSVSIDTEAPAAAEEIAQSSDSNWNVLLEDEVHLQAATPSGDGAVIANAVPLLREFAAAANAGMTSRAAKASETVAKPAAVAPKEFVRSAAVAVPRSYFVQIYLRGNTKAQEPSDALLQPVVDAYVPRLRSLVKNALGLQNDRDVTVEPYEDAATASARIAPAAAPMQSTVVGPVLTLNSYAREIALAMLCVVVGLLLMQIFRRPVLAAAVVAPAGAPPKPQDVLSGTVEEGSASGGGDDAEAHHLFRRVRDIVSDNPDDAARVLGGWVHRG